MAGDEERAKRVLVGYMSAQLQSGLAAMEAAVSLPDAELSLRAAERYIDLAEVARQLYCNFNDYEPRDTHQSHNWSLLLQELKDIPRVSVRRKKRLPYVQGDSRLQREILRRIFTVMGAGNITISFRRRGEDLVVALHTEKDLASELLIAGSRQSLFAAAKQPSLAAIRGYILARTSDSAGIRIVVMRKAVYLHFQVFRQLAMPFKLD